MKRTFELKPSQIVAMLILALGASVALACGDVAEGDAPSEPLAVASESILNGVAVTAPQGIEKALVHVGGCTGTMLTEDWLLTAMHCIPLGSGGVLTQPLTITHDATGVTRTSSDVRLPPDISLDAALVKVSPPLDVDPADPNPTLISVFTGDDSEAAGGTTTAYGYGYRDQWMLRNCADDASCPAGQLCDPDSAEGPGQCYNAASTVPANGGACGNKRQCPKGSDCDATRNVCYAPAGFIDVSVPPQKKCTSNASCSGNRLCTSTGFCGTPVGCTSKLDCPAGFTCDQGDNRCIKPSVLVDASQCNMASFCSSNSPCGGDRLCIDRHCCNPISGLRRAEIPVRPVARNHSGTWGAPAWNGKVISFEHPTAAGQGILSGDSGGPYFFNDQVFGVTSSSGLETYAGAFRDWVRSTISPQGAPSLDQRGRHGSFGAGADLMKVGDLNGDGRADLLWFQPIPFQSNTQIVVSLARSDGNYDFAIPTETLSNPSHVIEIADVTGDGADDVVAFQSGIGSVALVLQWTGSSFRPLGDWGGVRTGGGTERRLGDVNGDSYADVVNFGPLGDVSVAFACGAALGSAPVPGCAGQLNRFGTAQPWASGMNGSGFVGDFNGDGYADVMVYDFAIGLRVALTETTSCTDRSQCVDACHAWAGKCRADLGQRPSAISTWGGTFSIGKPNAIADINGDRNDDLMFVATNGRVQVSFANPRGGATPSFGSRVILSNDFCRNTLCLPGDNNHDGRDDVIKFMLDSVIGEAARDVIVGLVP